MNNLPQLIPPDQSSTPDSGPFSDDRIDIREALFNEGTVGPITRISLPVEQIGQIRGILFDLDLRLIRPGPIIPTVPLSPPQFYDDSVAKWLARHDVLAKAEVRDSGGGLHVILRFAEPLQFETAADRDRWSHIVKVVQAALPIDPDQPGITATTRGIGSVNSKNGAVVAMLREGEGVTPDEILRLYDDMCEQPFRTVMSILLGGESTSPCPVCLKPSTALKASDYVGQCYESCGKVKLADVYDLLLLPRDRARKE